MATIDALEDVSPPYLHPEYEISTARSPQRRLVELPRGWSPSLTPPGFDAAKMPTRAAIGQ